MDSKKYDKLRKKNNSKNFENNNKELDYWLFRSSFLGNIASIFFAFFLVYPNLLKTISLHIVAGFWGNVIALSFSIIFLALFEVIKRILIKNFSDSYLKNNKKIKTKTFGWLFASLSLIFLTYYLSVGGAIKLAKTSTFKNSELEISTNKVLDSIKQLYDDKKSIYVVENEKLRAFNNVLRDKLIETPISYRVVRSEYQKNIDKNLEIIQINDSALNKLNGEYDILVLREKNGVDNVIQKNEKNDLSTIFLFMAISTFIEILIIAGVYFREYYEHVLYHSNQHYEKFYIKRDRYLAILSYIYNGGKLQQGDKVVSVLSLKEIIKDKTKIPNSNKFVDDFIRDMDRFGVFVVEGKKRYAGIQYQDATNLINNMDDTLQTLENIK